MNTIDVIAKYAPILVSVIAAIMIIVFVKEKLFSGMITIETHKETLEREKQLLLQMSTCTGNMDLLLQRIEGLLKGLGVATQSTNERLSTIEHVLSDVSDRLNMWQDRADKSNR